jgi:hypothetical protein
VKFGISVINKIYRTSAINGIIGFIEILWPINFSLVTGEEKEAPGLTSTLQIWPKELPVKKNRSSAPMAAAAAE